MGRMQDLMFFPYYSFAIVKQALLPMRTIAATFIANDRFMILVPLVRESLTQFSQSLTWPAFQDGID